MNNVMFGQYYNSNSWIHRLDPRTKIISVMFLMISIFLLNDLISVGVCFGLVLVLVLSTKIPFGKFLNSLRMMTTLLFITVLFQLIFNQGVDYIEKNFSLNLVSLIVGIGLIIFFFTSKSFISKFRFTLFIIIFVLVFYVQTIPFNGFEIYKYSLKFYEKGLITSLIVMGRIISLILISTTLTLTTTPTDLNNGLESLLKPLKLLGIKVSILTMMISIALRFIPTLLNEATKILKAQASRGVDFKEGKLKDKVNQIISLLIPMLVISLKRAYDLADTMGARGYIPGEERTSINFLKFRFIDYFVYIIVLAIFGLSIYYRIVI